MDLPYVFKADGEQTEMTLDPDLNLDAFIQQITGKLMDLLKGSLKGFLPWEGERETPCMSWSVFIKR